MYSMIAVFNVDRNLIIGTFGTMDVRVLSRIYRFGEKSRVAKGHELPRGVRGHAPPEFLKLICAEMQSGAF